MRKVYLLKKVTTSETKISAFGSFKKIKQALLDGLETRMTENEALTDKEKEQSRKTAYEMNKYCVHFPISKKSNLCTIEQAEIIAMSVQ